MGFGGKLAFLLGGFLIWAAQFAAVYAITGVACARGGADVVPAAVLGTTAFAFVAAASIGVVALLGRGPGIRHEPIDAVRSFWRWGAVVLAGTALIAIVWTGLPALLVAPCG
jgi:hypothetical protein